MMCVLSVAGELYSALRCVPSCQQIHRSIAGMESVNNILIILCYTILHGEDKHKDTKIAVNQFFLFFFSFLFPVV